MPQRSVVQRQRDAVAGLDTVRGERARNALGAIRDLGTAQTSSPPPIGASGGEPPAALVSLEVDEEIVSLVSSGLHMKKGSALLATAKVATTSPGLGHALAC
ncbi:MAG: hypothetical protein P8Y29_01540, partial [Gemmatimonadota bacterium]